MDRMKSNRRRAPKGLGAWGLAMLLACLAAPPSVVSQTGPPLEFRGVLNEPVVITLPVSPLRRTVAGTMSYRARVTSSPAGATPAIEAGERGVIVTCFVPGVYLLQVAVVAMEQTSCSAGNETVLEELEIKLMMSP
ncbi:MAG: hypothetical protein AB9866_30740 [Syntrophobacteraceae bacterium]